MIPLLGWPLLILLAAVTVTAVVAALLFWTRTPGPTPVRVAQRLMLVVLCQVGALSLVAAAANDYGYFYGSWSELLGQTGAGVVLAGGAPGPTAAGGRASSPVHVAPEQLGQADATASAWSTHPQWTTRGRVVAMQVNGPRSALSTLLLAYLPPQYFLAAYRNTLFPATIVMTGYPGNTLNLVNRMRLP